MTLYILESNENAAKIVQSYILELGINVESFTDYKKGLEKIKENKDNPIIIASNDNGADIDVLENLKQYSSRIIITSTDYSTNNVIRAMRLGAKEFLPKPVIKNDLFNIIRTLKNLKEDINTKNSKIITIFSNKGGIGKTTIAVNLAYELSKTTRDKVALLDLNLQLGDIATFLNITPSFDVNYVINKLIEKKEDSILNSFEKYKDTNLYILSDPQHIEHVGNITPQKIEILLNTLRKIFPYIIIDLSSSFDANTLKILDNSDLIFFTSIINLPAIRNSQRCLNLLKSRRYPDEKIKLIINRYIENEDIKIEEVENAIGDKIYWKVPNNYFSILEAINKGLALGELGYSSNIANSFRDLANKITDEMVYKAINNYRNKKD